jgi:two-component system cell cycle sensor histidine kinase/response regulator CckA
MSNQRNIRVLLAEDDYLSGEMIKELLEEVKYTVVGEATDGLEAVEMARSLQPDVVLMDIEMPGVDGIEATRLIVENWEHCPTPVVMLTAYETEELVAEASAAGAGAYLVKPPDASAIMRAITIAMARFDDMMALRQANRRLEETLAELKAMQQELIRQERLAAVGQLAAGVAHEFNNIMASIILTAELMLRSSRLLPEDQERLTAIYQEGHNAARLTQQIMDFGRKSVLRQRDIDLISFMTEAEGLLRRTLPDNINIHLECSAANISVNADPDRLQQAMMNLVFNARDAMPEGGELRIELERVRVEEDGDAPLLEMEPGEWVRVAVSDTGVGISPDILPHIFEPFFTTRAPLGSGLGLAQVYGIVKQHKGYIDVGTKVGEGTTFTIYLPPLSVPVSLETTEPIKGDGETILVVEDNSLVRQALMDSLKMLNYCVLGATDGREALALLEQHGGEIALVLYDPAMSAMGRMELSHRFREIAPSVRVVILTDYPQEGDRDKLAPAGVVGWLRKPVSLEQLAQVVAHALE